MLTRFAAEIERVAERHGGQAGDLMGDGLMCVFGVPAAHEDDALRAVRAAAEMAAAVERLNKRLRAELDVELAVRIGVNTGEVVASGRSPVLGDAINVAARLEQAGAPGEILIGEATHLLVRDAVEAVPVAPVAAKGKEQPVPAWRLVRVLPGAPGLARRLDAPLLERERELAAILQAFERAAGERTCHLVTVLGDAGHRQVAAGPGGGGAAGGPGAGGHGALLLLRRGHHLLTLGRGGAGTLRWRGQSGVRAGRRG